MNPKFKIFQNFLFIGVINTFFAYSLFILLFYIINNKEIAITISFLLSILFNYKTYSKYVFNSQGYKRIYLFTFFYLFTYFINLLHLWVMVDVNKNNIYLSQFIALLYIPVINFYLNKKFVYSEK